MRIIVEGWRYIPHSYAVIGQFLCLELLKRPALELFFRDAAYFSEHWKPSAGLLDEASESLISRLPTPSEDVATDVTLRIFGPMNFEKSQSLRTCLFGTVETGSIHPNMLGRSTPQAMNEQSNIAIWTSSSWSRDGFLRSGVDPSRVVVIPLGFDPTIYGPLEDSQRSALRKEKGWENSFVFLHLGAMSTNKGLVYLLKSFAQILDRFPEARLVLKGLDSLYDSERLFAKQCGKAFSAETYAKIMPRILFIGKTLSFAEIAHLYQAADAYVSPYITEGFNLPVLEAAACGLPIICTRGGAADEFTTDDFTLYIDSHLSTWEYVKGVSGTVLVPDQDHLTELMKQLLTRSDLVEKCRRLGPEYVASKFTWKRIADRLLALFEDKDAECWKGPPSSTVNVSTTGSDVLGSRGTGSYFESSESSPEKIRERVAKMPYWYHRIELPGGIQTPGWAPMDPRRYGIPEDLSGKRVLDIGAWDGYWTFEALKRGAREAIAIDDFSDYLGILDSDARTAWKTFDLCREAFGHTREVCDRIEMSIYDISVERLGKFDVVFFFGVIYHLRYPLLALDRIAAVCEEELYVESAILDDFSPYRGGIGKGYPNGQFVAEFYPKKQYGNNETNWWVPTLHCLLAWCSAAGFSEAKGWKLVAKPEQIAHCRGHVKAIRNKNGQ